MHIHNVYFWLKEDQTDEDVRRFEEGLWELTDAEDVESGSFGKPAKSEARTVVDQSFSYGLVLCFEDVAAHNRYQAGTAHTRFAKDHAAKWDRVVVYDIQT